MALLENTLVELICQKLILTVEKVELCMNDRVFGDKSIGEGI